MPQRSGRPGFGSIPYPGGVAFRVWAPNATAVTVYRPATQSQPESVLGDLAAEGNGCWSADVSGCSRAMSTVTGSRARWGSSAGLTHAPGRSPTPSATSSSTTRTGSSGPIPAIGPPAGTSSSSMSCMSALSTSCPVTRSARSPMLRRSCRILLGWVRVCRIITRSFPECGMLMWYGRRRGSGAGAGGEVRGDLPSSG